MRLQTYFLKLTKQVNWTTLLRHFLHFVEKGLFFL